MNIARAKRLSSMRAQLMTLAGRGGGFFVQYDYVSSVPATVEAYPEVERLCEAAPYLEFLSEMASHIEEFKGFGRHPNDPRWDCRMLSRLDGAAAYAAVKKFKPKRIIEVGSGDSTFFLTKASDSAEITCIDPAPRREIDGLPVTVVRRVLENSDADLCAELEPNDIFFIDSSHILLPGMDVDIEFNRIFPRLKPGVIVHVHDIFLPFDYPGQWKDRNWNEQNALIGWLFGSFDIIYPGHYVARCHADKIDALFGDFPVPKNAGSIWLRKR